MTQDKDREAFEKWFFNAHGINASRRTHYWKAWQAARDHYAPKLTEKEAANEIRIACDIMGSGDDGRIAVAALKAAGMRFIGEKDGK